MSAPYQLFINSFEAVSFSFQISENVILKNLLEIMKLRLKIEEKKNGKTSIAYTLLRVENFISNFWKDFRKKIRKYIL